MLLSMLACGAKVDVHSRRRGGRHFAQVGNLVGCRFGVLALLRTNRSDMWGRGNSHDRDTSAERPFDYINTPVGVKFSLIDISILPAKAAAARAPHSLPKWMARMVLGSRHQHLDLVITHARGRNEPL